MDSKGRTSYSTTVVPQTRTQPCTHLIARVVEYLERQSDLSKPHKQPRTKPTAVVASSRVVAVQAVPVFGILRCSLRSETDVTYIPGTLYTNNNFALLLSSQRSYTPIDHVSVSHQVRPNGWKLLLPMYPFPHGGGKT